jgi:glycosyltransferase 2 family protein
MAGRRPRWGIALSVRRRIVRLFRWGLAVVALAFVVWVVPIRDRCWDPRAPASTALTVTRDGGGCVLHVRTGDVRVDTADCAKLQCEPGVGSTLARANVGMLLAVLAVYAAGTLAWAARWRLLLGFAGIDMTVVHVWRISTEAQAAGILLPGGIGGDALRIASVLSRPSRPGEERPPAAIAVASVLLDRAIGLSVMAAVAAALGFALGGLQAGAFAYALAGVPLAVALGMAVLRRAPLQRIGWLTRGRLAGIVGPVLDYVRDPRAPGAIARATALSVVVAAVQFATIRGIIFALGAEPTQEKWVYVGSAMAFIVGALPTLPGGWGTTDAAYVFFLGQAGLPAAAALAVCLLYRLFWYLSGVVGAVLQLARPRALEAPE